MKELQYEDGLLEGVGGRPEGSRQEPRQEPKQERARRTRDRILQAAAEIFAVRSYPTVTLQDVADRMGMTKGAVYFHYKNKEALAVAVVEAHYVHWGALVTETVAETTARELSPLQRILAVLDRVVDAFRHDVLIQAGARLQLERALIQAELPRPYRGWIAMLTELATEADAAGELREGVTPTALAHVIVSSVFGMQHISDTLTGRTDLMTRYKELRPFLLAGAAATAAAGRP
ncbi:ScbR family autoregulator-binding transcription factor [Streptomyces sp. NPDC046876]|uniref:ScbR family autoregulator-binding transcription factor n=1 Tax=Streptomyces sp. NPDC046876 TaxID=3155616 RepID=UPI0033C29E97